MFVVSLSVLGGMICRFPLNPTTPLNFPVDLLVETEPPLIQEWGHPGQYRVIVGQFIHFPLRDRDISQFIHHSSRNTSEHHLVNSMENPALFMHEIKKTKRDPGEAKWFMNRDLRKNWSHSGKEKRNRLIEAGIDIEMKRINQGERVGINGGVGVENKRRNSLGFLVDARGGGSHFFLSCIDHSFSGTVGS